MNKNITITAIALMLLATGSIPVFAQTGTKATIAPTKADIEASDEAEVTDEARKAVEELKEKVESKVSELSKTNVKTRSGFITSIKEDTLTVEGEAGSFTTTIDGDLTTVYRISGTSRSEIESDDLKKGDYILVTGPEIGNEVTANTIHVDERYFAKSGKIIEVNSDDFYVTILTLEKDEFIIDIERGTTSQILDIKTLALETAGFSKLKEGDNLHFVAKKGMDRGQTRFSATKTIIIPQEYFIK